MALPRVQGDNPSLEIIPEGEWVKIAEDANIVIINDLYPAVSNGWYTYLKTGDSAPLEFSDVPNWRINDARTTLKDSDQRRDWYIWSVKGSITVVIEMSGESPIGKSDPIDNVPQSNTSPWNDFYFVQANGAPTTTTVAILTAGDTRILSVASIANISIGDWIGVFTGGTTEERYYWTYVEDINDLDLTLDTLIDYTFPVGATVLSTVRNMAVDGSAIPQVFAIQAGGGGGDLEIDISRVMLVFLCDNGVNLSTFGDIIGGLTRPMYLRVKENGVYRNKLGAKTNKDLALMAYDWNPFAAINPQQGQDGFIWRFSLGGMDKHDAVSRVSGGNIGSLEWVIQSDLTSQVEIESVGANSEVTP